MEKQEAIDKLNEIHKAFYGYADIKWGISKEECIELLNHCHLLNTGSDHETADFILQMYINDKEINDTYDNCSSKYYV